MGRVSQAASQAEFFAGTDSLPSGLRYWPDAITPEQERDLVAVMAGLPFKEFEFQGFLGKRRIVSFGWRYDFNGGGMTKAEPIPPFLFDARAAAARLAGLDAEHLQHVLVTEYQPGATIGWHKDRPQFEDVIGISLLAPCPFRLRRKRGSGWERYTFRADPRSVYLLRGPARTEWEHSISALDTLRYSITFRSLKKTPKS
jgi:alkylated DNA repair dioxygenase AlkB